MQNEALNNKLRKLVRLCLDQASTPEEAALALSRAKTIAAKYDIPLDSVLSESLPDFNITIDFEVRFTASAQSTPDAVEDFAAYASAYERTMSFAAELANKVTELLNEATANNALFYAEYWQDHLHGVATIMADIPGVIYVLQPPSDFQRLHTGLIRYATLYSSRSDLLRDVVERLRIIDVAGAHHAMKQVRRLTTQLHDISHSLEAELSSIS